MSTSSPSSRAPVPRRSHVVAGVAAGAGLAMLAASFAAVPLYRMFCAATGYGGTTQIAQQAPQEQGTRELTVRFDGNVAPGLEWKFSPATPEIRLRTGQTATVYYEVTNLTDKPTAAIAAYNVSPAPAGAFFNKINCFCFDEQKLGPRQSVELPVVFFLDPALEKDATMAQVSSVTLSYTLFASKSGSNPPAREGVAARDGLF